MQVSSVQSVVLARLTPSGASIRYGNGKFWLDNHGVIPPWQVEAWEDQARLDWTSTDGRDWFIANFATTPAPQPASAPSASQPGVSKPVLDVWRWILLAPATLVGAYVVQVIIVVVNRASIGMAVDSGSFLAQLLIGTVSNTAFGVAFVRIATLVAPARKRVVAVAAAAVLVGGSCLAGLRMLVAGSGWDVYALVVSSIAASLTALATSGAPGPEPAAVPSEDEG